MTAAPTPTAEAAVRLPEPTWLDKAAAVGLWGLGLAWMVPMMGLLMAAQRLVGPDRVDGLARLYCRGQVWLTGTRRRVVLHSDVDPHTPYLFVQNHVNHFDHVTLYPATPHFKQGIELEEHFRIPVYGWFMRQRGTLAVRRGARGQLRLLKRGFAAEVAKGHSLLAFPEGTRTLTGRVGPFHRGLLHVARDLSLPVVPVAVTGMYEVMRKGSWVIRPGRTVTVYVEAPVETAGRSDEELAALAEEIRTVIARRVDAYWAERGMG